jgi:hypothetical protein
MSNDATTNLNSTALTAPAKTGDGFDSVDDGSSGSIIKGSKIKFTNSAEWLDEAAEVVDPKREFGVVEIAKYEQKWLDAKPVETRVLGRDEHFRDVEKLNAEAPETEWCEKFGKKVGPWQNCIAVYLFDPKTLEAFTWPTSTAGGFRAVAELKERVRRARMIQGDNVFPLVTLADTHMKTQFGGRQRPQFKVVRFITLGGTARPLLEPPAKPEPLRKELNDEIPFS